MADGDVGGAESMSVSVVHARCHQLVRVRRCGCAGGNEGAPLWQDVHKDGDSLSRRVTKMGLAQQLMGGGGLMSDANR
jgi:hypothetical protein